MRKVGGGGHSVPTRSDRIPCAWPAEGNLPDPLSEESWSDADQDLSRYCWREKSHYSLASGCGGESGVGIRILNHKTFGYSRSIEVGIGRDQSQDREASP